MVSGERQHSPVLSGIRGDHVGRYLFATRFIRDNFAILDTLCGVGYGSNIMARTNLPYEIVAFDQSEEAIEIADRSYAHPLITFLQESHRSMHYEPNYYDLVTCFEAIEHVDDPERLLGNIEMAIKPGGLLLISSPNEKYMQFKREKYPFHVKHYTQDELASLLESYGLTLESWHHQNDKMSPRVHDGADGLFMIAVARKA